ncbi:DUF2630 family protein [Rhodococcus antarcticus]|jgi:hypothetical protein|uniref:DUF2630 family protein n=1 Tax=Rhodococcus antarcticus TaxID=2987751 RepID=A0ABY6P172_9NOCA|nr:DUF2630 family protein [Rhodococcus antarcticus]UZJ25101.1 DUF2630 family protein [Rhodococcus antarcticus]
MDDRTILAHIDDLVAEERVLHEKGGSVDDDDRQQLTGLTEQVDQSRDLLRQRRTRREQGEDPGLAEVRPADEVEHHAG